MLFRSKLEFLTKLSMHYIAWMDIFTNACLKKENNKNLPIYSMANFVPCDFSMTEFERTFISKGVGCILKNTVILNVEEVNLQWHLYLKAFSWVDQTCPVLFD